MKSRKFNKSIFKLVLAITFIVLSLSGCAKPNNIKEVHIFYGGNYLWVQSNEIMCRYNDNGTSKTMEKSVKTEIIIEYLLNNWSKFSVSEKGFDGSGNYILWDIQIIDDQEEAYTMTASKTYPPNWNDFIDILNETLGGDDLEHVEIE
jgi:hypothetical protein